jgi:hypothetical protein
MFPLCSIKEGVSAAFSRDDRVMAVYVRNRTIQIWDLPPRLPWLLMIAGAVATWLASILGIRLVKGRRRGPRPSSQGDVVLFSRHAMSSG